MLGFKLKVQNILLFTEKYTKTDMKYLVSGGFWMTLSQLISMLASFVLTIFLTGALSQSDYGSYQFIISVASIFAATSLPGMNTAISKAASVDKEGNFWNGVYSSVRWGALGALGSLAAAGYYYLQGNTQLAISFSLITVLVPFVETFGVYRGLLVGRKNFKDNAIYGSATRAIAVGVVLFSLNFTFSPAWLVFIYFASVMVLRFLFLNVTLYKKALNNIKEPTMITYGKHLSVMGIAGTFVANFDKLILFHFLGATDLAIYTLAIIIPEQIKGAFKNIAIIAMPKFAKKTNEDIRATLLPKLIKLMALMSVLAVVYVLVAPYFFAVFFPEYSESVLYSQVAIIGTILAVVTPFFVSVLVAKEQIKSLYTYRLTTYAVQIGLLLLIIPAYGIMGAVVARIIMRVFELFINVFLWRKTV